MSRLVSTLSFVLLAAVLAAVAAGCGEDPEVAYQRDLREVGTQVAASLDRVPTDSDEPVTSKQIAHLADRLRDSAGELEDLDPPSDATRTAQATFVRGLRKVATALVDLARDLDAAPDEADQAERFVEFATDESIEKSFDDLEDAQDAFARAGFRVFEDTRAPAPGARAGTTTGTAAPAAK